MRLGEVLCLDLKETDSDSDNYKEKEVILSNIRRGDSDNCMEKGMIVINVGR